MHRPATLLVTAVLLTVLSISLAAAAAWPDGAQQIIYARDYVTCTYPSACDGSQAKPWTSTDGTGGIQAAINACGLGLASGAGCVVMLPRGVVSVSSTIQVGVVTSVSTTGKQGIVVRGHGAGGLNSLGNNLAGTTLLWTGPNPGALTTVMRISAVSFSTFADFSIDGGARIGGASGANIGIDYTANTRINDPANNPGTTQQNIFENMLIENLSTYSLTKGVAFRAAPGPSSNCDCQVAETSLRSVSTKNVPIAYQQDGAQTTGMKLEDCNLMCTDTCLDLQDGDTYVYNSYIGTLVPGGGSDPSGDPVADIRIGTAMHNVVLVGNTHESCSSSIILADSGTRFFTTTMIGERLQQFRGHVVSPDPCASAGTCSSGTPCYIVNYKQNGPLVMTGGFYFDAGSPSGDNRPRIHVEPPSGQILTVTSHGNTYANTVKWDDLTANSTYVDSNDRAGTSAAFESANWLTRNIGTGTQHPMVLQNQDTSGATNILAWITQGARFRLYKQGGGIEFQGADSSNYLNLQPASTPSGIHTVSLPNSDGTVLLDTNTSIVTLTGTQSLTNKTLNDASNKFPESTSISFTYPVSAGTGTLYCSPGGSVCSTTETNASMPFPRSLLRRLSCRSSAQPGGSRTLTLQIRAGAGNAGNLNCTIGSSSQSCSNATPTDTYATLGETNVDLRAVTSGSGSWPSGFQVVCSVLSRPGDN